MIYIFSNECDIFLLFHEIHTEMRVTNKLILPFELLHKTMNNDHHLVCQYLLPSTEELVLHLSPFVCLSTRLFVCLAAQNVSMCINYIRPN